MSRRKQGKEPNHLGKSGPEILVDSGPLLAIIAKDDPNHTTCVDIARQLDHSFFTTLPAFTDALTSASDAYGSSGADALWKMVFDELLIIENLQMADYQRIAKLQHKHEDIPLGFTDASLIAVSERLGIGTLFTTRREDFIAFKANGKKSLSLIGP